MQHILNNELEIAFVADHQALHTENSPLQLHILCQETLVLVTAAEHRNVITGADLKVTRPLVFVKGVTIAPVWDNGCGCRESIMPIPEFGSFRRSWLRECRNGDCPVARERSQTV